MLHILHATHSPLPPDRRVGGLCGTTVYSHLALVLCAAHADPAQRVLRCVLTRAFDPGRGELRACSVDPTTRPSDGPTKDPTHEPTDEPAMDSTVDPTCGGQKRAG